MTLQIMVHHILQDNFTSFIRLHLRQLQTSRVAFRIPCHPPSHQRQDRTKADKAHGDGERHRIVWRILAFEDLWTNSTPNLTIAVDKANRERRTCSSRGGLDSPWPLIAL